MDSVIEVAKALPAPLDVFVVRKLGVPGHEELAIAAIASSGVRVVNGRVVETRGISAEEIERIAAEEQGGPGAAGAGVSRRQANAGGARPNGHSG